MIVFLVVDEVENEKHMSHVNKAVGLVRLLVMLVHREAEVVPVILVVLFEVLLNLVVAVSTWNVLHHDICSVFFSSKDLVEINWASIVVART